MSRARLVITAVVVEGRSQADVAVAYGVSKGWVSKLLARYREEGEAAFELHSRRPKTSPASTAEATVTLILELREKLTTAGLDAGPDSIAWHLQQHHQTRVSLATISRYLTKAGLVVPEPRKRPKSSYIRFQAAMPNETWQSDFTHYRLTTPVGGPGKDVEIISWLDDCTRYALNMTAHLRVSGPIVLTSFRTTVATHGIPVCGSSIRTPGPGRALTTTSRPGAGRCTSSGRADSSMRSLPPITDGTAPAGPRSPGGASPSLRTGSGWS